MVQDVFVELFKGKGHYDGHRSVKGYLLGVAKKIISQYYKQTTRSVENIPIVSIDKVSHSYDNQQSVDPARKIIAQELKTAIEDITTQLPTKARESIRLMYINGLSLRESAEKAGCSIHTFCQRILDAKKTLRKYNKMFEEKLL